MSGQLVLRLEALLDVKEGAAWYEDQRPGLGERFTAELDDLLARIARSSLQFPEIEQGVRSGLLRKFPYAVYFLREDDLVIVFSVLHQRRNPDLWKSRV
ncbi:MAG TPA: type II toxin-antitoxin system RelE/ParE family toxin [Thermoanaerobaculia bacterium]|nr:type II toxin-antitoxin system RelE/ParE family toxin [Thermoanaerobaculia bacterium]